MLQLSEASPISFHATNDLQVNLHLDVWPLAQGEAPGSDDGDNLTYLYQPYPMMLTRRRIQICALSQHE